MPQCRRLILRNDIVPCQYFLNVPVAFKVVQCHLSNLRKCHVALSNLRVKGPYYGSGREGGCGGWAEGSVR